MRNAPQEVRKDGEINWFGEKVGSTKSTTGTVGGGVGKYLQVGGTTTAKRPAPSPALTSVPDEPKKKRKVGFGEFEGW